MKKLLGRWESRGGKYWVELYEDRWGLSYCGDGCGGNLGNGPEARQAFDHRLAIGDFQADKNATAMRQVFP